MRSYEQIEAEILNYCEENKCLWEDKDFPPNDNSLWKDVENVPEYAQETNPNIKWKRPQKIIKLKPKFCIGEKNLVEMKAGSIGHTWFMGAIAIMTSKSDIIERLFVDSSNFNKGFVSFQFFKNGEWKQIIVDTYLPYDTEQNILVFSNCLNPSEFWVPLLEKAYAKLHGTYEEIMMHNITECLVDLTGGVSSEIDLDLYTK